MSVHSIYDIKGRKTERKEGRKEGRKRNLFCSCREIAFSNSKLSPNRSAYKKFDPEPTKIGSSLVRNYFLISILLGNEYIMGAQ